MAENNKETLAAAAYMFILLS